MIVGGYDLHLYCDRAAQEESAYRLNEVHNLVDEMGHAYREFPHEYYGQTRGGVTRQARAEGWSVNHATGRAICPKCNRRTKS